MTAPLTDRVRPFTLDESERETALALSYDERVTAARFAGHPDALDGES